MLFPHEPQRAIFQALIVETNTFCNRKCWFCKFGQDRSYPSRTMGWEVVEKVVADLDRLEYKNRISWVGINEPLIDKRLPRMVALAKQRVPDAYQSTITNGDLLTAENYTALRDAGLDSLAISVYDDGAMSRSMKLKALFPEIHVWDKRPYMTPSWAVGQSIDFTNRAGTIAVLGDADMVQSPCLKPMTGMSILPSGQVPLCTDDMYGDVDMGNVMERTLDDIWFGEKFERYRMRLSIGRQGLDPCRNCSNKGGPHHIRFP